MNTRNHLSILSAVSLATHQRHHAVCRPICRPVLSGTTQCAAYSALRSRGFTLVELLVVMAIIGILAGLTLGATTYIQKKGAMSRAQAEMAGLTTALESYRADNGNYPTGTNGKDTGTESPGTNNQFLRAALAPTDTNSTNTGSNAGLKQYFSFHKGMGGSSTNLSATNVGIIDPFGEGYGYQYPGSQNRSGINFFDLWSRSGSTNTNQWLKNW